MSLNNTLNDQLAHASKKFAKACDQIKILKIRIAELITMFSYCDPSIQAPTTTANTNTSQHSSNYHDSNTISNTSTNTNANNATNNCGFNVNIFKESIRQQIENLQSVKTAYFMYAHRKADEITRLQCELYGEDAVRVAYENAPPDVLIPASNEAVESDQAQSENESSSSSTSLSPTRTTTTTTQYIEIDRESSPTTPQQTANSTEQAYWTPWDFNGSNGTQDQMNVGSSSQIQLIEYDFLTA